MKYFTQLILIVTLFAFFLQNNVISASQVYFQQRADFKIKVQLDDVAHYLFGDWQMIYTNNSPDTLDFVLIHLWPNAYRTKTSALAKQMLRLGNTDFHFADMSSMGGIKDLTFSAHGDTLNWSYYMDQKDIAIVHFNSPLLPGGQIVLNSPFTIKIPDSFSRMGHVDQSYQITQWYPKPAVYDREGWHPMSYLDLGEFYSEFGNYEVHITLPANYTVASTGVLQNKEERQRLQEIENGLTALEGKIWSEFERFDEIPPSDTTLKTLVFMAENVHDFAWFADKRYGVLQNKIVINGREIETWAYFKLSNYLTWKHTPIYIHRTMEFFSEKVGDYPYPQVTIVDAPLKSGGGMEYPMITSIVHTINPKSLDIIVAHEIGHNWFYGILGFNEREHPWLDEGLTTYYERIYTEKYYQDTFRNFPVYLYNDSLLSDRELIYRFLFKQKKSISSCGPIHEMSLMEYYIGAYEKPAMAFSYLATYFGEDLWDQCIRTFFETWKFKHPGPVELQLSLEASSGQSLNWFFDGLICQDLPVHISIKSNEEQLIIANNVVNNLPIPIRLINKNGEQSDIWMLTNMEPTALTSNDQDVEKIIIDPENKLWIANRAKLEWTRTSGNKWESTPHFKFDFVTRIEGRYTNAMYALPMIGYNVHDGMMLGMALHNTGIPAGQFEYYALPFWGFRSKNISGHADLGYLQYLNSKGLHSIRWGLHAKSYHVRTVQDIPLRMIRLQPSLEVALPSNRKEHKFSTLSFRSIHLWEEQISFQTGQESEKSGYEPSWIKELKYTYVSRSYVQPYRWTLALEQQNYTTGSPATQLRKEHYLKAWTSFQGAYYYNKQRKIKARVFAGAFLLNSRKDLGLIFDGNGRGHFSLFPNSSLDYRYDEIFGGRGQNEGLFSQQVSGMDGGFKNAITSPFPDGLTNRYLIAINLGADLPQLPQWLPVSPYFDAGYTAAFAGQSGQAAFDENFYWSGGLQLDLLQGIVSVYFPILNSENINRFYGERGNYLKRISFSWRLGKKRPADIVRDLDYHLFF